MYKKFREWVTLRENLGVPSQQTSPAQQQQIAQTLDRVPKVAPQLKPGLNPAMIKQKVDQAKMVAKTTPGIQDAAAAMDTVDAVQKA